MDRKFPLGDWAVAQDIAYLWEVSSRGHSKMQLSLSSSRWGPGGPQHCCGELGIPGTARIPKAQHYRAPGFCIDSHLERIAGWGPWAFQTPLGKLLSN